jgi:uncharacterized protein (DUF4415 family)
MVTRYSMVFGKIPDAASAADIPRLEPQQRRRAASLPHYSEQHLDESRLACAVRTQQTEYVAALDSKRDSFQRFDSPAAKKSIAVRFSQVVYVDYGI